MRHDLAHKSTVAGVQIMESATLKTILGVLALALLLVVVGVAQGAAQDNGPIQGVIDQRRGSCLHPRPATHCRQG